MVCAKAEYDKSPEDGPFSAFVIQPIDPENHDKGYNIYVNRGFWNAYLGVRKARFIFYTNVICSGMAKKVSAKEHKYIWYFD